MTTISQKEFTAEDKETITFYSDSSSDEYDYQDITDKVMKDTNTG